MTNDIVFVLVSTFFIITVIEIVDLYFIYKKRRLYQKEAIRESCRREFAILRTEFFELSRKGAINIDSVAAQFVFLHLTSLVRRPEHFKEYINQYIKVLQKANERDTARTKIFDEIKSWPSEAHEIIAHTGRTIDTKLIFVFSPLWFRTLILPFQVMHRIPFMRKWLEGIFNKEREKSGIAEYKRINSLCSST